MSLKMNPETRKIPSLYEGLSSYDGNIHLIQHLEEEGVRLHIPHAECWCDPEYLGKNEEEGNHIWSHRRVH